MVFDEGGRVSVGPAEDTPAFRTARFDGNADILEALVHFAVC